mmetsp:Transcript_34259/g.65258  ORF Transcript_34259/g.65258 Transcript_34259/m.65258 type:complete len:147 (-) Transcript_34259:22-462(-)|eukprot:CAMPEP_0201613986 /NCGR_PEP_ID=MMETSP0492-20130828/27474_1 /ASSEMBLY_ACC=CAM_ASM_000837 /TAXON_ID=420259 /ORGANISM="Thalassiosira gravida, Strain GMp14c1" /LENGTH=146 /DNA_ID=CAMNT_0048081085 /DNA_START=92 /DNA_END=532 /DNA_ORIENTATION=+
MTLFCKLPSISIITQLLIITFLFHSELVNAFANRPSILPLTPPQSSHRDRNNSPTTSRSRPARQRHSIRRTIRHSKLDGNDDAADVTTEVGSSEYYRGFLTRSVDEEPIERVTGDAVLGPTLKFAGGISLLLVVLTAAFLVSNGIA